MSDGYTLFTFICPCCNNEMTIKFPIEGNVVPESAITFDTIKKVVKSKFPKIPKLELVKDGRQS